MDFEKYYKNQIDEPVYRGVVFQRGHGFGDVFKKFFRWIVPIVKQYATPIASSVGKEALKSAVNIANDTIDGKNLTDSTKERIKESLNILSNKYGNGKKLKITIKTTNMYKKNKKNKKQKIKKRKLDIFD